MVDSVGSRMVALGERRVSPAATAGATTPVAAVPAPASPTSGAVGGPARSLAASPPVDHERVARIKTAIADGRFPILPAAIADRMIAFRLDWKTDDAGD